MSTLVLVRHGKASSFSPHRVLDRRWAIHNGSLSSVVFSSQGLALESFNATPHLGDPRLVTTV